MGSIGCKLPFCIERLFQTIKHAVESYGQPVYLVFSAFYLHIHPF